MKYQIHRAVVIGSGTMGAALAAHLANAGVPVKLLDIVPERLTPDEEQQGLSLKDKQVRNRITREGYQRALKSRPASFFTSEQAELVSIGNLDDNLDAVAEADWVIEAIVENLEIKRALMKRIDDLRGPNTIVSTNTSGIPVCSIAEGRSESFRQHFLGTHFFNPPRYLKLLEIIPTEDTLSDVVQVISHFGEYRLGKGIVPAKDTPNFIGNRIFAGWVGFEMDYILENGYTVDEVDAITGPPIGHPKTATFRLFDLIGIDVWAHVSRNLGPAIAHDEQAMRYLKSERVNRLLSTMVERGWFGNKIGQGFYKMVRQPDGKKEFWPLNLVTIEHQAPEKVRFESIGKVKDEPDLGKRLTSLIAAEDRAGQLVKAFTYQALSYASERIPEIADTPKPIDDAMRWGFGHEAGPFEIWDMLGVAETTQAMKAAGLPPAAWVDAMLASGKETFYQTSNGRVKGVYNPATGEYEAIPANPAVLVLSELKAEGKLIKRNPGASLVDLGDGVICVEFHTKMNTFDDDIHNMVIDALDLLNRDYAGLVIGNDADNFSAGANLFMIAMGAQNELWDQIEAGIRKGQDIHMRMRYSPKPVVVAPAGLALAGGAELSMHASRIVAAAELYTGLVEFGVGVIPAWGGTKEIMRRVLNPAMRTKDAIDVPYLQRAFEQIGLAKLAASAEEARQMGILGPCDRVVMNRDHLLAEAKREVLNMVAQGYKPPIPEKIYASGRDGLAALKVGVYMLKEGGYASEHDALVANKLASVLTGGDLSSPTWVSEQYILDLEREAFLSLAGEKKSQERMWHMLQTGKPLRN